MSDDAPDDELSAEQAAQALSLLASALPPRAPSAERRAALLAELRGRERFAPFMNEVCKAFNIAQPALRAALERVNDDSAWQPGFGPGSRVLTTPELARAPAVLARLAAGSRIESHTHAHRELTYVLDGELLEDDVRSLRPGELLVMEPGTRHAIAVATHSECLVVFAVHTQR